MKITQSRNKREGFYVGKYGGKHFRRKPDLEVKGEDDFGELFAFLKRNHQAMLIAL